jgi:hypothetical protein
MMLLLATHRDQTQAGITSLNMMVGQHPCTQFPKAPAGCRDLVNISRSAILSFDLFAKRHFEIAFCQCCHTLAAMVEAERDTMAQL